jgi:DNA-binding NarL/FixJ family response regulator
MSLIYRVLVVDDSPLWRRQIHSMLQRSSRWQVVGEAADGLEAVQKAEALQPDLILLDVGLPTLNGIQAARRILARNPGSRILFVSQHQSWAFAEDALGTGARGYLVKSSAGADLLPAMEAIVSGGQFVSPSLAKHVFDRTTHARSRRRTPHVAGFYASEAALLDDCAQFGEAALKTGSALIVITVASRRDALQQGLQARGIDVDRTMREGRYLPLDLTDTLSQFMVDDWPDEARFWTAITPLMLSAANASAGDHPRVAAWGEGAPTLWREGNAEAAIRLEHLWEEVVRKHDVETLCGYYSKEPFHDEDDRVFKRICAAHSAVHSR